MRCSSLFIDEPDSFLNSKLDVVVKNIAFEGVLAFGYIQYVSSRSISS